MLFIGVLDDVALSNKNLSPNLIETKVLIKVVTENKFETGNIPMKPRKPDVGQASSRNSENICGNEWQERYARLHKNGLKSWKSEKKGRFLVYSCKKKECKGGYGNRMRALASLFYLAILTDRVFLIDWETPTSLDKYLETERISWNYRLGETTETFRVNSWQKERFPVVRKLVAEQNMDQYFNNTVEVVKYFISTLFKEIQQNPILRLKAIDLGFPLSILDSHVHSMGCAFRFLFRLNHDLKEELEETSSMMGYNEHVMLSIYVRTGDLNTFRRKSNDLRLPRSKFKDVFSCARLIQFAIQKKFNTTNIAWFLATDSWDLKNYAELRYPHTRQYRGLIEHIEISTLKNRKDALHDPRNPPGDGMRTIMLELYLMAKSDFYLHFGGSFGDAASALALAPSSYYGTLKKPSFKCIMPKILRDT